MSREASEEKLIRNNLPKQEQRGDTANDESEPFLE